jgi:hypothetical protein
MGVRSTTTWYHGDMSTRASILEHVINPKRGDLAADLARYILSLDFPETDQARFEELSVKAQQGRLTDQERAELEDFLNINDFLTIVQSKARVSLGERSA